MKNTPSNNKLKDRWKLTEKDIQHIIYLFHSRAWPKNRIARKYHIDHTTVIYHIKKHAKLNGIVLPSRSMREVPTDRDLFKGDDDEEYVNRGGSYDDYLNKDRIIQLQKQDDCMHTQYILCTYKCRLCGKMHTEEIISSDIKLKLKGHP